MNTQGGFIRSAKGQRWSYDQRSGGQAAVSHPAAGIRGRDTPEPTATPGEYLVKPESAVKFTRAAALWSALITGFLILIVLLVFIMQNTDSTTIDFFGWEWNLPVGVAILLAAVCGGLLTVAVGTAQDRSAATRRQDGI